MIQRVDFVPDHFKRFADSQPDYAVPISNGITVPGREVTRLMTELLDVKDGDKVLLIGTGSGYQTSFVAEQTGAHVDSLDIRHIHNLHEKMPKNVRLFVMDGLMETPEGEEYDAIMATCAVPIPMLCWADALKPGGRLVAPVGKRDAHAIRKYIKLSTGLDDVGDFAYCRFMSGEIVRSNGKTVSVFDVRL